MKETMQTYRTEGVCAKEIRFALHDGIVEKVEFSGGCQGNLAAISKLLEGMRVEEVVAKFKGNICRNQTSCTDQLARALEAANR